MSRSVGFALRPPTTLPAAEVLSATTLFQVEAEILVAGVDDLHGRQHDVDGGEDRANVTARPLERRLGHHRDLGLDPRVDEPARFYLTALGAGAVVGEEAVDGLLDAHLLHLGPGCQAHLEAGDLRAPGDPPGPDRVLDVVGILPVPVRVVVGDLDDLLAVELGVLDVLGELLDGFLIEGHVATTSDGLLGGFLAVPLDEVVGHVLDHVFLATDRAAVRRRTQVSQE